MKLGLQVETPVMIISYLVTTDHSGVTGDQTIVHQGEVIAWVSDKLACKRRTDLESNDLEALWLEVRSLNFKFFVCTLYRTSSNSDRSFWDKLQSMLFPLHESGAKFITLGDLNADPSTLDEFIESNLLFSFISSSSPSNTKMTRQCWCLCM